LGRSPGFKDLREGTGLSYLTPLDVVNQSFKRGFRGYETAEVDDFLDQVAESLQAYIQRNKELERDLETMKEQMEEFKGLKESLNEALILAQRSAEERVRAAHQQAEAILADAKARAEKMIADAEAQVSSLRREMNRLTQVRCQYVAEFRAMLSKFDMMIREEAPSGMCDPEVHREGAPMADPQIREAKPPKVERIPIPEDPFNVQEAPFEVLDIFGDAREGQGA